MGLIDDAGKGPIGLDTAPFIYLIEEHPRFLRVVEPLFVAIDTGRRAAATSTLTLLETLVVPYRVGDVALAEHYEAVLAGGRGLRLVEMDRPVLRAAAALRARTAIRTPDAIQLASALSAGCTAFVTGDRRLPSLPGLRVLALADYA